MRCCLCLVVLDILRDQMVAFDFLHTQSPIFSGTEDLHALKKILCWRKSLFPWQSLCIHFTEAEEAKH